jgi:hypothetical protein
MFSLSALPKDTVYPVMIIAKSWDSKILHTWVPLVGIRKSHPKWARWFLLSKSCSHRMMAFPSSEKVELEDSHEHGALSQFKICCNVPMREMVWENDSRTWHAVSRWRRSIKSALLASVSFTIIVLALAIPKSSAVPANVCSVLRLSKTHPFLIHDLRFLGSESKLQVRGMG